MWSQSTRKAHSQSTICLPFAARKLLCKVNLRHANDAKQQHALATRITMATSLEDGGSPDNARWVKQCGIEGRHGVEQNGTVMVMAEVCRCLPVASL